MFAARINKSGLEYIIVVRKQEYFPRCLEVLTKMPTSKTFYWLNFDGLNMKKKTMIIITRTS